MAGPVLHPTDFSRASGPAFTRAMAEARDRRSELVLVHVLSPGIPVGGDGLASPTIYEDMIASARAWAQKHLDRLVVKAKAAKLRVRGVVVDGVAHEQIVRTARGRKASLIVMGTHGRTGVARFFLGSVAARVAAMAPCPVLTVRGR
jgi:nucleotide-binding universal stress UspA family protein